MDFQVSTQEFSDEAVLLDQTVEQTLDAEETLPDYLPDVSRVLACRAAAGVSSCTLQGGKLRVEGETALDVMGFDAAGDLCGWRLHVPFERTLEAPGVPDTAVAEADVRVNAASCRVLTARKLDLHGSLTLSVRAVGRQTAVLPVGAEGAGVQLQTADLPLTLPLLRRQCRLTVRDEIDLAPDDPAVRCLLRADGQVRGVGCKTVSGRTVVKGDLAVTAVTAGEDGRLFRVETLLPFSQVVDTDGAGEDDLCEAAVTVSSLDVRPRTGADGACRTLSVSAELTVTLCLWRPQTLTAVTDAFSTAGELTVTEQTLTTRLLHDRFEETYRCRQTVTLPDGTAGVADAWASCAAGEPQIADGALALDCRVTLSLLLAGEDGGLRLQEQTVESQYRRALPAAGEGGRLTAEPRVQVQSVQCTLTGPATADVSLELAVTGRVWQHTDRTLVGSLQPDGAAPAACTDARLTVCYADGGERLWDVAKRYRADPAEVAAVNDRPSEPLVAGQMLLIPHNG